MKQSQRKLETVGVAPAALGTYVIIFGLLNTSPDEPAHYREEVTVVAWAIREDDNCLAVPVLCNESLGDDNYVIVHPDGRLNFYPIHADKPFLGTTIEEFADFTDSVYRRIRLAANGD